MPQKRKTSRKPAAIPRSRSVSSKSSKPASVGIHHRAKRLWHATPKFVHGAVAGAFIGIVTVVSLGIASPANALTIDTPRDCDDYAIIRCGSVSTGELQKDYKKAGVSDVYDHFGISSSDISKIDDTAVKGTIYDDGSIKVNGKLVATDAITAAWKSVNGSTKVTRGGTTFYVRHLKVSWSHKSAPAYVVMKNGVFEYAVLASCGNPIKADAVPPPKPTPTPPPPTPKPTPTPPTPKPTPTPPTPTPTPPLITPPPLTITPSEEPEALPNAGPGALLVVAAASVAGGFIAHHGHRHYKRRKAVAKATRSIGKVGHSAIKHSQKHR